MRRTSTCVVGVLCVLSILFNVVSGHGYLSSPVARTGDETSIGGVKKFAFASGYGESTNATLYAKYRGSCRPAPADAPAGDSGYTASIQGPAVGPYTNYTVGVAVDIQWVITIDHPSAPGVQVSVDYAGGTNFTTIAAGVDVKTLKLSWTPSQVSDHAVIQWIWESKQDGGGYIGCADVRIAAAAAPTNSSGTPTPTSTPTPTNKPPSGTGAVSAEITISLSIVVMLLVSVFMFTYY